MNKNAYAKMMGLAKVAQGLFGPTVTAAGNKQKAKQVAQAETNAKARRAANLKAQKAARTASVDKAIAENKARQTNLRQQEAGAKKQRAAKQKAERAEIAKGVQAADAKHKQEQAQDRAALAKQREAVRRWQENRKLVAQHNALKDREARVSQLSKTPTELAEERIDQQRTRNKTRKALGAFDKAKKNISAPLDIDMAFSKGTGEYNAKKQLEQTLAPKGDPMKLIRSGVTNQLFDKAKKNISAPVEEAIKGNNPVANILADPLSIAGDPNKLKGELGKQMFQQKIDQLAAKNKAMAAKLGIPEGADPAAVAGKQLGASGAALKKIYDMIYPKNSIENRMSQLNQQAAATLEANRVRQGLGNVFDFDKFNKGKMSDAAKAAFAENANRYAAYKDKGWWERLLAWIKQMWAGVSGGNPLATERGVAMQAGKRAGNIWSGLSDKIRNGLLEGK